MKKTKKEKEAKEKKEYFTKIQIKRRLIFEKKMFNYCDMIVVQNEPDKWRLSKIINDKPISVFSFYETHPSKKQSTAKIETNYEKEKNDFILVAAQGWAHKRIDQVIEAYDASTYKLRLVIIGKLYDQRDSIYTKRLENLIASTETVFMGYVSENKKNELFRECKAVMNFSKYEGWNSSVEEALFHKKPLILSDMDFHRDQVCDAMFIKDKVELTNIFSGVTEVKSSIDYDAELRRRKTTVKNFIKELQNI